MAAEKKLMLLGGSRQQVVAIETARRLGYATVLCDYLPNNPGRACADKFYPVSTTDKKAVLEVARAEDIDGVIAYSSDPASLTAAYVAEQLGLPTNPLSAVEAMGVKCLFREHMSRIGLPCPRSVSFSAGLDADEVAGLVKDLGLPVVIKPTDSSGSKGISVLDSLDGMGAAMRHAARFGRNGTLIAEEYIRRGFPHVIGGDVFVMDGRIEFWGLMSCLRDERSPLVPVGKKFPAGLSEGQELKVKDALQRLVTSFGIRFGELNIEVIIGEGDTPYVLELGGRAGGNMIPVQLSDVSGVDLVRANVMCAMGDDPGDVTWDPCSSDAALATYVLHSDVPGKFVGVELSEEIVPHVYRTVEYVRLGDTVEAFDGADKALGIAFLKFDNVQEMEGLLKDIYQHIRPIVEVA